MRQLAGAADVSDRMLLYYFKDKADVMTSALVHLASRMSITLDEAVPVGARHSPVDLFQRAAALTGGADMAPFMNVFVEATAAAMRGEEPYQTIAQGIAEGFLVWLETRLDIPEGEDPRACAAMLLGMIDGLVFVRVCAGEAACQAAMAAMASTLAESRSTAR